MKRSPKSRWVDGVEEDARKLRCRNGRADVQDRGRWRHLLEEAKAHPADDDDDDDDDSVVLTVQNVLGKKFL